MPRSLQLPLELSDAELQLLDPHVVVGANVGRRAYDRDPVALGFLRHRQAVGEVKCTIVQRRQDVTVKINHEK